MTSKPRFPINAKGYLLKILPRLLIRPSYVLVDSILRLAKIKLFDSQSNESSIIESYIEDNKISLNSLTFFEFGFGPTEFNCIGLSRAGILGHIVDSNTQNVQNAKKILHKNTKISCAFLNRENLADYCDFERVGIVSIDVDGNDYEFAELTFQLCKPKLLIVEFNPSFGSHRVKVPPIKNFNRYTYHSFWHGASITALTDLAHAYNYCLLKTSENSVNAFFVPSSTLDQNCHNNLSKAIDNCELSIRSKLTKLNVHEQFNIVRGFPLIYLDRSKRVCPNM